MANPKTTEYLESLGIDASRVAIDGIGKFGYYEFLLNDNGERYYTSTTDYYCARKWREWPEGFDYDTLIEKWREDGRSTGIVPV